jgi:hypothetical protein
MIQHASTDQGLQPAFAPPPRTLGVGRLGIVEELLADLDTATHAGQRYTMGKVVGLLRDEARDCAARSSELQRRWMKRSLDELAREQDHLLPDRDAFVARAQTIARSLSMS